MKIKSVFKASVLVFIILSAAKLLNFFKKILIGQLFGVSQVADSFFAASYLPYYAAVYFEGILFLGFLPLFSQVVSEQGMDKARRFLTSIFVLVSVLTGSVVILACWQAPWIMSQIVPGFSPSEQSVAVSLFKILTLVILFVSLSSFFKTLNSYFGDYVRASSSAVVDAAVMVVMILATWKFWGIYGAAWAAVVGALAAAFSQGWFFINRHMGFDWDLRLEGVWLKKLLLFLLPMLFIWFFQQIPFVVVNRFGSGMWEGTISSLNIAQTLTTVPMGLVSNAVLFAVFPSLAKQAQESNGENLNKTFFDTLRGVFLILVPAGFLLTGLARPFVALFFSGGGISDEGARRLANALVWLGWSTFALYADLFMTQSLIAIRRTKLAIGLCLTRALLSYFLSCVFSSLWDYQGLALAFSAALVVNLTIFFPIFLRRSPFGGKWKELFIYTATLCLAGSPVAFVAYGVTRWTVRQWMDFSPLIPFATMTVSSLLSVAAYLLFLHLMKVREMNIVYEALKQNGRGGEWPPADQIP